MRRLGVRGYEEEDEEEECWRGLDVPMGNQRDRAKGETEEMKIAVACYKEGMECLRAGLGRWGEFRVIPISVGDWRDGRRR